MTRHRITLIIALGLLVLVAVALGLYRLSPRHSLLQIAEAVNDRDAERFKKYVDVEQVSAQVVDSVASTTDGLAFAMSQNMRPSLIARFKSALLEGVEAGDLAARTFAGIPGSTRPVRIAKTVRHGKVADVDVVVVFPRHPEEFVLKIQLRDRGTYWQLFRLINLQGASAELNALDNRVAAAAREARIKADQDARERAASTATSWSIPVNAPQIVEMTPDTPNSAPIQQTVPAGQVKRIVGYKEKAYQVPGHVAFDRAHRDFHVFGCPSVTPQMEEVNHRTLEVQGVPRNADCADRPLPYETRMVKEPIYETPTESTSTQ